MAAELEVEIAAPAAEHIADLQGLQQIADLHLARLDRGVQHSGALRRIDNAAQGEAALANTALEVRHRELRGNQGQCRLEILQRHWRLDQALDREFDRRIDRVQPT